MSQALSLPSVSSLLLSALEGVIVVPLVARAPSGGHLNTLVILTRYFSTIYYSLLIICLYKAILVIKYLLFTFIYLYTSLLITFIRNFTAILAFSITISSARIALCKAFSAFIIAFCSLKVAERLTSRASISLPPLPAIVPVCVLRFRRFAASW